MLMSWRRKDAGQGITMVLTIQDQLVLLFFMGGFQLLVRSKSREIIEMQKLFLWNKFNTTLSLAP